jgi:hypothetical protein
MSSSASLGTALSVPEILTIREKLKISSTADRVLSSENLNFNNSFSANSSMISWQVTDSICPILARAKARKGLPVCENNAEIKMFVSKTTMYLYPLENWWKERKDKRGENSVK